MNDAVIRSRLDAIVWQAVDRVFTAREHGRDETADALAQLELDYLRMLAAIFRGYEYAVAILREGAA